MKNDALQSKSGRLRKWGLGITIVLIALMLFLLPSVALALDPPDSLSIESAKGFRNLAEIGDMLVVFECDAEYASYPDTPASQSMIFRFYESDNGTLLAQSQPYVYWAFESNGYGQGVSAFYFDNQTAPDWGEGHRINALCTPAYYDPIQEANHILTDYSVFTDQADAQNDVYNYVMTLIDDLHDAYPDVILKTSTDTGTVLSVYGESYFRAAIPGLQTLCPELFFIQVYVPEKMEVETYTMEQGDEYTGRLEGTDLMRGAERLGDTIGGVSGAFVFGILAFGGCILSCILTMRQGWGIEPGMVVSAGLVILGAILIGNVFFTLTMIGGLVGGMAIMFIFAYKRA